MHSDPNDDSFPMSSDNLVSTPTALHQPACILGHARVRVPPGERQPNFPLMPYTPLSTSDSPDSLVIITTHEHKIRGLDYFMRWYKAENSTSGPPDLSARTGDLFLHQNDNASGLRFWIWDTGRWIEVVSGHQHPLFPDRVLHILPQGEPRWITRKTMTTYKGRKTPRVA
jgi:hypothetical protein